MMDMWRDISSLSDLAGRCGAGRWQDVEGLARLAEKPRTADGVTDTPAALVIGNQRCSRRGCHCYPLIRLQTHWQENDAAERSDIRRATRLTKIF